MSMWPAWMGNLTVSRTYHSRNVSTRDAELFGPNFSASFAADGGAMAYKGLYNHTEVDEQTVTNWVQQPVDYAFDVDLDLGDEESGSDPFSAADWVHGGSVDAGDRHGSLDLSLQRDRAQRWLEDHLQADGGPQRRRHGLGGRRLSTPG